MNTTLTQTTTRPLSAEETSRAAGYLASTRDDALRAVDGLSPAQWNFSPGEGQWSVLEILEHLAIIEARVAVRIADMSDAELPGPGHQEAELDGFICIAVPQRSQKIAAPPPVHPLRQWTPLETIAHFRAAREHTLHLLATAPCLRGRVFNHPILGPWDGYQWILATAAHTARHLHQMAEVKAHPDFPRS